MGTPSRVSVIIIFLNAERFLQEAIESVFAQTYRDWELLLVDDGSTDGSTAMAHQYAAQYPERVRYLEHAGHRNRGMAISRNLGWRRAKGCYIAFLDADDCWLPHKLEQQIAILDGQPDAAMAYGLSQWWYSWVGERTPHERDFVHELGVSPNSLIQPPLLFRRWFLEQTAAIPCPSDILVRREVIEALSGFDESFRGIHNPYEDQAFYAKLCLRAPIFAASEVWDRYRQHPDSSCAVEAKEGQAYATRLYFLDWLSDYLSKQRGANPELTRLLARQRRQYRYPILHRLAVRKQDLLKKTRALWLATLRRAVPLPIRSWVWAKWQGTDYSPPVGQVRFGSLRRLTPLSREFGFDRGLPIDRYYIEQFLAEHRADIHGHVLEIEDDIYTRRFGGARVTQGEVLHVRPGEPKATIVADLTRAGDLPCDTFDCVILTQTLQFIYDVRAAITSVHRILKPGGVVLATVPGINQISRYDMERWGQYWSFTTLSAQQLFAEVFPPASVTVEAHGSVLTAISALHGLACQELRQTELDFHDRDYEVIITVRAVKPKGSCSNLGLTV